MKKGLRWKRTLALLLTLTMLFQTLALTGFAAESGTAGAEEASPPAYPYLDTELSFAERAADLVSRMTLEEKCSQLGSNYGNATPAIPRLGVQANRWWNEALHGIARNGPATSFPTGLGIAATWDPALVREMASMAADEGREKYNTENHNMTALSYWSPTLNMARDPRWGRMDETYGEDPFLTGQIGDGFVRGLQGEGEENGTPYLKAIATPKHFLANNSEVNRRGGESTVDLRDLREYYTPAFKEALEVGGARSIMTSYNAVNGVPMSANKPIMEDIVRKTWGFDGFVVTDCGALQDVVNHKWRPAGWDTSKSWSQGAAAAALDAGVDYNCGTVLPNNTKAAINAGLMSEDDVDVALVRLFTARMQVGEFDSVELVPYSDPEKYGAGKQLHAADHDQMAEDFADQAVVLLKNDAAEGAAAPILPLKGDEINNLVLVGDLANKVTLGGYSTDHPGNTSTAVQGIEAALRRNNVEAQFTYIPGTESGSGAVQDYLMNIRGPKMYDKDGSFLRQIDLGTKSGISGGVIENKTPPNTGSFKSAAGGWVKFDTVDFSGLEQGRLTVEMVGMNRAAPTIMELRLGSPSGELLATVSGVGDTSEGTNDWNHWVEYTFSFISGGKEGPLQNVYMVVQQAPGDFHFSDADKTVIEAADAVVAFIGTGEQDSFEGQDRQNDKLPRGQEAMVNALAELNPNTVVYIQAVGQVSIESFKDKAGIPAICWCTYNGQAQGNAAGRILFGEKDPAAKLPFTWYSNLNQLDNILDYNIRSRAATEDKAASNGRTYQYFTGDVTYPFGYGLSYSSFEYDNLRLSKNEVTPDDTITVTFDVTNTSGRDGEEIAQVYVVSPGADKEKRPAKRLKGFDKQEIGAGQTVSYSIDVPMSELYYWDVEHEKRAYEQGTYTLQAGPDSGETPLTAAFTLTGALTPVLHAVSTLPTGHILDADHPEKTISTDLTASYSDETFVDLDTEAAVQYTSSDSTVAKVNRAGVVMPVSAGTAVITANVTVGAETRSSSFPVAVSSSWVPSADNLYLDGAPLTGFKPDVLNYSVSAESLDVLPEVTADVSAPLTCDIVQATVDNPTATVTVSQSKTSYTVYKITFQIPPKSFDFTNTSGEDLKADWTIQHEDPEKWSIDSNGLKITTQRGDFGYANEPAKNVFLQSGVGDWQMDAKVDYSAAPSKSFQQAGILVYQDDTHFIKLDYEWKGSNPGVQFVWYNGGGLQACGSVLPYSGTEVYYRIEKKGNQYTGSYSPDGQAYTEFGTITLDLADAKLGLMAFNGPSQYGGVVDPLDVTFQYLTITQEQNCTCGLYDLAFPGGKLTLPTEGELEYALSASAKVRGGCVMDGHAGDEIVFSYAIDEDSENTAEAVMEDGVLKAAKPGTVEVTVTAALNEAAPLTAKALFEIEAEAPPVSDYSIEVSADKPSVRVGEDVTVTVTAKGGAFVGAACKLDYESDKFDIKSAPDGWDNPEMGSYSYYNVIDSGFYEEDTVLGAFVFTAREQDAEVTGTFRLTDNYIADKWEEGWSKDDAVKLADSSVDVKITPAPAYVVEIVGDYVAGHSLVLVYTDNDTATYTYGGNAMYDVTGAGYKNEGTGYAHVYGLVTSDTDASAEKVAEGTVPVAGTLTYSLDVNGSGKTDLNDAVAVVAVYNANGLYMDAIHMNIVLKADVNRDKKVDVDDFGLIKAEFK